MSFAVRISAFGLRFVVQRLGGNQRRFDRTPPTSTQPAGTTKGSTQNVMMLNVGLSTLLPVQARPSGRRNDSLTPYYCSAAGRAAARRTPTTNSATENEAGDVAEVDKDSTGAAARSGAAVSGHLFLMHGRFEASRS